MFVCVVCSVRRRGERVFIKGEEKFLTKDQKVIHSGTGSPMYWKRRFGCFPSIIC
jgi:hypothetical protein